MSLCEHCVIADYYGLCSCDIDGGICAFMRRCSVEHRWLPLNGMNDCTLRKKSEVVLMKGEYNVLFERNGNLCVEIGDFAYDIPNPFDYVPTTVNAVEVDGQWYVKGYEPVVKTKKEVLTEKTETEDIKE